MSTVQSLLFRLAQRISPVSLTGQRIQDATSYTTISNATSHGGLIQITSGSHGLNTGDQCNISGVVGVSNANNASGNPSWTITRIDGNNFDLVGSTFTGTYSTGGLCVGALIGSVDMAGVTRQRLLDIYNDARMALFNALYETKTSDELSRHVYGAATTTSVTIAALSGAYRTIAKPAGFMRLIGMTDSASSKVPIIVLPNNLLPEVKQAVNPNLTPSNSNLLAFELGQNWAIVGNYGTTPALIDYYGLPAWTIATDVLAASTVETFSQDVEPILIEIAVALFNEQSMVDATALAKMLLNKGK
jgi:hypothetical protein